MRHFRVAFVGLVLLVAACGSNDGGSDPNPGATPPGTDTSTYFQDSPEPGRAVKVAFIGDQGLGSDAEAVLRLIKEEGADMVLHQGDFDYEEDPEAWDAQITKVLGGDYPYFASAGNHDHCCIREYQQVLQARLARVEGASCEGELIVQATCTYRGLFMVFVAPDVAGSGHETYIRDQLTQAQSIWRICSWHKVMEDMNVGGKGDEAGWGVYEECRKGGGIVATAHEHSYARTHLVSSFQTQEVASTSSNLVLEEGKTFAFHSGLGGDSVRDQEQDGEWWAAIYTATQEANFGALFCSFFDSQENHATCYFKDIEGRIADQFELVSAVGR